MDAVQVFLEFIGYAINRAKARRYTAIARTKRGQLKILVGLYHGFAAAVRPNAMLVRNLAEQWEFPCYGFHQSLAFGEEFGSVREAYAQLALRNGWLIVLRDASLGIHRPEGRWDSEVIIARKSRERIKAES